MIEPLLAGILIGFLLGLFKVLLLFLFSNLYRNLPIPPIIMLLNTSINRWVLFTVVAFLLLNFTFAFARKMGALIKKEHFQIDSNKIISQILALILSLVIAYLLLGYRYPIGRLLGTLFPLKVVRTLRLPDLAVLGTFPIFLFFLYRVLGKVDYRIVATNLASVIRSRFVKLCSLVTLSLIVLLNIFGYTIRQSLKEEKSCLIILVDCLRADHVSAYGYHRTTTPYIDSLVKDGVLFDYAISQSNWTKPSMASLFTSLYPSQHKAWRGPFGAGQTIAAHRMSDALNEEFITLGEAFKENGFITGAFINQPNLAGYLGFSQGFDYYDWKLTDGRINSLFLRWLPRLKFFAYIHYNDLHYPYAPSEAFDVYSNYESELTKQGDEWRLLQRVNRREITLSVSDLKKLEGLYDGQLKEADNRVGLLIEELKKRGEYAKTMVIVTADHGEGFWEHGTILHGLENLYGELVRVPLIIKFPFNKFKGKKISEPVQLIDIMPTALAYFDIEAPEYLSGNNLLPYIEQGSERENPAFTETERTKAVYYKGHKYILHPETGREEVYRYDADPSESRNLISTIEKRTMDEYKAMIASWMDRCKKFAESKKIERKAVEKDDIKKLKALGYIQ